MLLEIFQSFSGFRLKSNIKKSEHDSRSSFFGAKGYIAPCEAEAKIESLDPSLLTLIPTNTGISGALARVRLGYTTFRHSNWALYVSK
jgi:hypothetical protein